MTNSFFVFINFTIVKRVMTFVIIPVLFFSCSLPKEIPDIVTNYRLDLKIDNIGNIQYGLAILKDKPLYTLELTSNGLMDYLSFNSCSTTITKTNAGGILKRKETKINFRPNEIEKEFNCDAKIDITEKKKQRHTFGYVVFENPKFKLPAKVICGDKTNDFSGVSVCQNYAGNKIRIKFDNSVFALSEDCKIDAKGQSFDIITRAGFCNYYFSKDGIKHRFVVYGWTQELFN